MMQRVLITGGSGYLGSVIIGYLLDKGYHVTCLDNLSYRQKSLVQYARNSNFEFVYGDCRNSELLQKILPSIDVIIPLAAIVGMPACEMNPINAKSINFEAIKLINELRSPDQMLIYPTTNSGYGTKSGDVYCTEETPLEPISLYGQTKVNAENYLLDSEKKVITLRLATVFGLSPRMRTDLLVNDFVLRALRDGYIIIYEKDFKRNYVHILDVAKCFEHCITNFDRMKNNAYNVGLDKANLSKAELAETIKKFIPKFEIVYKEVGEDIDKRNYIVSNQKIRDAGFVASHSIEEGIKELIKGYSILLKNDDMKNV